MRSTKNGFEVNRVQIKHPLMRAIKEAVDKNKSTSDDKENSKMNMTFQTQELLNTIRGRFSPNQLSALLNMDDNDLYNPQNYLIWFHERFHYLESVFTPYGHLKWGSFRSVTAEIIEIWLSLTEKFSCKKKIPIASYLDNPSVEDLKIAATIWLQDFTYQVFNIIERGYLTQEIKEVWKIDDGSIGPVIKIAGSDYRLKGIDILESFAKYQEAMMGDLIGYKSFSDILDIDCLNPEYYSALFYFVEKLGNDRILEFPIACELSLAINHLPNPADPETLLASSPGWRFEKIIDFLAENSDLQMPDINSDKAFIDYSNKVLSGCGYETLDSIWDSAERYALSADLSMADEMQAAIAYKKSHPWILSYPMKDPCEFLSKEFNRFNPLFTITNNSVRYNLDNISQSELLFENHFQALALQICGNMSERCIYPNMLQCGFSYFGLNSCPHQLSAQCSGEIDCCSQLPELKLDEDENVLSGCSFELVLNIMGTSIKEIDVKKINQKVSMESIKHIYEVHS